MKYQYEDVHVHITLVARVAARKAATHPVKENTWASSGDSEALL